LRSSTPAVNLEVRRAAVAGGVVGGDGDGVVVTVQGDTGDGPI
jgi:hypothetical protein